MIIACPNIKKFWKDIPDKATHTIHNAKETKTTGKYSAPTGYMVRKRKSFEIVFFAGKSPTKSPTKK